MASTHDLSITSPPGLVSILIPCCGMLEYTKLCVPSVLRHSRAPFELIFLDVGSLDGTAEYLAGLRDGLADRLRVEVCRAATDLDIKSACQEALKQARGEFVCLLNNDTVVTPGWLEALTALAKLSEGHGLVGPMSNYAAPPQLVETVPYRVGPKKGARPGELLVDVQAVQRFAQQFAAAHKGKWLQAERLGGFCLLIRRSVLERVGTGLAEWSDLGLFDTDILSAKAAQAGFERVCCRDLFIHHFGTRTFAHGAPPLAEAISGNGRAPSPGCSPGTTKDTRKTRKKTGDAGPRWFSTTDTPRQDQKPRASPCQVCQIESLHARGEVGRISNPAFIGPNWKSGLLALAGASI
jgi:GT2 family glycosyltransferase